MDYTNGPIFVGLSGPAGVGKTSTASAIAPQTLGYIGEVPDIAFRHLILAKPIYEIVTAKRMIQGADRQSRVMYQLHETLDGIINRHIEYDQLVELVYDIYSMDAGTSDDPKPRTFMQTVGDMCRGAYEDCFVDSVIRRGRLEWNDMSKDVEEMIEKVDPDGPDVEMPPLFIMVSDVRRRNEVERLRETNSFIFVRLEADRDVLEKRLFDRDGIIMTEEQWNHATETEANSFPRDWFDLVLDTNNMDLKEQSMEVVNFLRTQVALPELAVN